MSEQTVIISQKTVTD